MKIFNTSLVLLLSVIFSMVFANGGEYGHKETKTYNKEFALKANERLMINNRYGHVNIKPWDKNIAKIDVEILVEATNKNKAQQLIDNITVEFIESSGQVSAETIIESSNSGWGFNFNIQYEINYNVMMPRKAFLDLTNKYGNADVGSLDNNIEAAIKYGNIDFEAQKGDVKLYLGYGKASLPSASDLEAEIKYSEMDVGDVNNVRMESKYSKFVFGQVHDMDVESGYDSYKISKATSLKNSGKYDDWKIGEVDGLIFDTKYTDIKIDFLHNTGNFYQKYGRIEISKLGATASKLNFALGYVNVTIQEVNTGYSMNFDGSYSDLSYSKGFQISNEVADGNDLYLKGKQGNGQTTIEVEMKYGQFRIF